MRALYQDKLGVTLHAGHWLLTSTIVFTLGAAVAPCTESSVYIYICVYMLWVLHKPRCLTHLKVFSTLVVTLILQLSELRQYLRFLLK